MNNNIKIKELLSLTIETFSAEDHDFTESTLRAQCEPSILVQLFAFNGVAQEKDGQVLHVVDWKSVPPEILEEARQILFIAYRKFALGKVAKPESDGSYIFKSVGAGTTVQNGRISVPDPIIAKKKATNLHRTVLI